MISESYHEVFLSFHIDIPQARKYKSVLGWEALVVWKKWKLRKREIVQFD